MTSKKVWPLGTNHTDSEGTPWKRDDQNNWWFWQKLWLVTLRGAGE